MAPPLPCSEPSRASPRHRSLASRGRAHRARANKRPACRTCGTYFRRAPTCAPNCRLPIRQSCAIRTGRGSRYLSANVGCRLAPAVAHETLFDPTGESVKMGGKSMDRGEIATYRELNGADRSAFRRWIVVNTVAGATAVLALIGITSIYSGQNSDAVASQKGQAGHKHAQAR